MSSGVDWCFNPFAYVIEAFEFLYPDKKCTLSIQPFEHDEGPACTGFPPDGGIPHVIVSAEIPFYAVVECLAHELAHVAVGIDHEHDLEWSKAFKAIHLEYDRLIVKAMKDGESKLVIPGKKVS